MRKDLVAFGIILMFAGVIVVSISTNPVERSERAIVAEAPVNNRWEVSAPFNKGEKLSVEFTPPNLDEVIVFDHTLKLVVEISSSQAGKTVFEIEFKKIGDKTVLSNITLVSKDDGLKVSDPPIEVGGIVPFTDNYLANITTRKNARYTSPGKGEYWVPENLRLVKEVAYKEYPYLFVLPIGILLIAVGGSLSLWGSRRSSKYKPLSRTKKR